MSLYNVAKFHFWQKCYEISCEISWNFELNFTKFHSKFQPKFPLKFRFPTKSKKPVSSTANRIVASNKKMMCASWALNPLKKYGANECAIKKEQHSLIKSDQKPYCVAPFISKIGTRPKTRSMRRPPKL